MMRSGGTTRSADALRRLLRRGLLAALAAAVLSCGRAEAPGPEEIKAGDATSRVQVYLIAVEDGGRSGKGIGCNDSVVAVDVPLPRRGPALEGALAALLDLDERFHQPSGLYNALYASRLTLERVEHTGSEARVELSGYLEIGGACDSPRILAELEETALQFADVSSVRFFLDGKPLEELLSGER